MNQHGRDGSRLRIILRCGGGDNGSRTSVHIKVAEEALMPYTVRVNLANPAELLELPGVGPEQARAILKFRAEHGPIQDARELAKILGPWPVAETIWERVDFAPSESTAPEAPGA
jgi:Helix-hairpin-helix motif